MYLSNDYKDITAAAKPFCEYDLEDQAELINALMSEPADNDMVSFVMSYKGELMGAINHTQSLHNIDN
jgi:hypothetical protein